MPRKATSCSRWIGLALFLLHVVGALRHQFLLKDGLLRRMGPGGSAALAGLLAPGGGGGLLRAPA